MTSGSSVDHSTVLCVMNGSCHLPSNFFVNVLEFRKPADTWYKLDNPEGKGFRDMA